LLTKLPKGPECRFLGTVFRRFFTQIFAFSSECGRWRASCLPSAEMILTHISGDGKKTAHASFLPFALRLAYSSIQFLLFVCSAAHVEEFLDGLPEMSNCCCHAGKAGGSPFGNSNASRRRSGAGRQAFNSHSNQSRHSYELRDIR